MLKTLAGDTDSAINDRKKNCFGDKILKTTKSKNTSSGLVFLTLEARLAFTQLRQIFTKALIVQHLDLKRHIWIETNASGYAIDDVLSQLTEKTG